MSMIGRASLTVGALVVGTASVRAGVEENVDAGVVLGPDDAVRGPAVSGNVGPAAGEDVSARPFQTPVRRVDLNRGQLVVGGCIASCRGDDTMDPTIK
jgi:hypothetical protein